MSFSQSRTAQSPESGPPAAAASELTAAFSERTRVSEDPERCCADLHGQFRALQRGDVAGRREADAFAARITAAVRVLPGGVVILDAEGCIRYFNEAASGLLGELHCGSLWRDVISAKLAPRWDDGHDLSLNNGKRIHIATQAIADPPGQVLLLSDTTEQRRFNDELSQAQRLAEVGRMAAGLAHQIRTPLATAMLYASQVGSASLAVERRAACAGHLTDSLSHLERLVEDTLLFARCGMMQREPVDLGALLRSLAADVAAVCGEDYRVTVHTPPAAVIVSANPHTLRSALQNLVDNAIDAADGGGCMRIEVQHGPDGRAAISFTDDGPGIPAAEAASIFEAFVTHRSHGTGLGLAVVRAVVHAHGGSIELDPTCNAGACFRVSLPLAATGGDANGVPLQ